MTLILLFNSCRDLCRIHTVYVSFTVISFTGTVFLLMGGRVITESGLGAWASLTGRLKVCGCSSTILLSSCCLTSVCCARLAAGAFHLSSSTSHKSLNVRGVGEALKAFLPFLLSWSLKLKSLLPYSESCRNSSLLAGFLWPSLRLFQA